MTHAIKAGGDWWKGKDPLKSDFYGPEYFKMLHKDQDDGNFFGAAVFMSKLRPRPGKVLEVGCCFGFILRHLLHLGWSVRGFDFSSYPIKQAHPEVRPYLSIADATKPFKFQDASFDLVSCLGVLNHVTAEGAQSALNEMSRVCKGRLFFTLHVSDGFGYQDTDHPEARGYVWIPTKTELKGMLLKARLCDVSERVAGIENFSKGSVTGMVLEPVR